ncbi:protein kinase [Chloroflexus islandicus]|uniref:non-specific serine/threonine protein kinase n=1 Tax=Chloroflexus islandicus TaxID=1707952 RepID=A0A178M9M8_9CHLR|nr:protein kinase [Chloroflexus islandicus]OAN45491.1 protein kinase [Chloroflexus islandicus]
MSTPRPTIRGERRSNDTNDLELRDYRLHEQVGQDELSIIYRATHQTLNRPVYVAILRRHDWISNSRFQLAARLAATLSHPHLLPVIDAGHDDRYGDYMVTPYIDARPLSDILAEGAPDLARAMRIISQIAAAIDYLHKQQVVHRDVQPANILVTQQGNAYLTNLSLAAAPDAPLDLSTLSEAEYLTPYSAPELHLAQTEAHPALDIYSLGAVAYHLLSGELPPSGLIVELDLAGKPPALVLAERVLLRMLSPQPNLRFLTASAAANALRLAVRTLLDQTTTDMEEAQWETYAEWFENPLELALTAELSDLAEQFNDFLTESRKRADLLHQRNYLRRWLNYWSRQHPLRRQSLGQLIEFESIASYNIYFYELKVLYEFRTSPKPQIRPMQLDERPIAEPALDVWKTQLPPPKDFASEAGGEVVLPGSRRFFTCPDCQGSGQIQCPQCQGKGMIKPRAKRGEPEPVEQTCPQCRGYGKVRCDKCAGNGNLVEEKVFRWSRKAIVHENNDDSEGLPPKVQALLRQRARKVYEAEIDLYDSHWHSAGPLSALIELASKEAGEQGRPLRALLQIKGAMVTQINGSLDEQECELYLIRKNEPQVATDAPDQSPSSVEQRLFDKETLVSTISLWNWERIALAVVVLLFVVMAMVVGIIMM